MARGPAKTKQRAKERDAIERTPERSPQRAQKEGQETRARAFPSERASLLSAGFVFLVALALYSWTLAPTVTLVDSGELIVAARSLGVAHPPGFPLYLMLAHLATLAPFGNVAARVNFASALFGALSCAMLTLVVAEVLMAASCVAALKRRGRKRSARRNKTGATAQIEDIVELTDGPSNNSLLALAPAIMSGLLLAFSRTLWSYATITEVYTLNTLLILVIFFLLLRWRRRILEDERRARAEVGADHRSPVIDDYDFLLYAAAVVFGLALGVHHVTVALTLPALALLVYKTEGVRFFKSRRLAYAALLSLVSLLVVYAYLPVAASRAPAMNWGNPRAFEQLWWHITGRQYQVFLSFSPEIMGQQLVEFGKLAAREFGPWWLPPGLLLALAGFITTFRGDRTAFWFLALVIIGNMVYALNYDIAEDKDAYYLPTFVALAIAAGLGVRWLIELARARPVFAPWARALAAALVLLVAAVALAFNLPYNNRSRYFIAHDYVENILSTIEPGGLLLTLDWQVESPMLYAREVEQRRTDARTVDVNLLRRSWYFDYLRRAYPALIERSRDKVDAFVAELRQWERDPEAYANNMSLAQRIDSRFQEMLQSFVTSQIELAPVYVTSDIMFNTEGQDAELAQWLGRNYQLVPHGLVFKLAPRQGYYDLPEAKLQTRGLVDGTLKFEETDVVKLKVLPVYKVMFLNRGRYLALFGQHTRAIDAFKQALALDPNLDAARQGLNESLNKLREGGADKPK
jgi:tetratricopeptide (TPR) repeat protein